MADPALKALHRLVGSWTTEATHPAMPGVLVHGNVVVEWLEGERFLIHRAVSDHPDFPDSISIIGFTGQDRVDNDPGMDHEDGLRMHYYDSRGVFRVYEASLDDASWRLHRDAPGFMQRFTGKFDASGNTIVGLWQIARDDVHYEDDLAITYRRRT
jgi:hypothetical protein